MPVGFKASTAPCLKQITNLSPPRLCPARKTFPFVIPIFSIASLTPVSSWIGLGTLNGKSSSRATHNLTPDAFCIASAEKYASARNLILLQANNECADQPAHPRCLISAFFYSLSKKNDIYICYMQSFNIPACLCS